VHCHLSIGARVGLSAFSGTRVSGTARRRCGRRGLAVQSRERPGTARPRGPMGGIGRRVAMRAGLAPAGRRQARGGSPLLDLVLRRSR